MNKEEVLMEQIGGKTIDKYELIKRDRIEESPFDVVETEKGFFIGLGQYRLTDFFESGDICHEKVKNKDWELLFSVFTLFIEQLKLKDNEQ